MIRPILTTLSLFAVLTACASHSVPKGQHIGEPMEAHAIEQLSTVQSNPSDYFNKTVLVEARIKSVCQSKGCWMQIEDGGQPALVRWETGCGGKYAFPKDAIGEMVVVQGSFYPKEISPEDAEHMKEEAGTNLDIPAKGYEFNASSVVLVQRPASE